MEKELYRALEAIRMRHIATQKYLASHRLTSSCTSDRIKSPHTNTDTHIPDEKRIVRTADNGKKYSINTETGETSGLGDKIDNENEEKVPQKQRLAPEEERRKAISTPRKTAYGSYIFPAGTKVKYYGKDFKYKGEIEIKGVTVLARGNGIDRINQLLSLGGTRDGWTKKGGTSTVEISGVMKTKQIHFFEDHDVGCVGLKIIPDSNTRKKKRKRK